MADSFSDKGDQDSPSLGEVLLCDLKNTPIVCPVNRQDLTTIKCRGDKDTRAAHWSILRVLSPYFRNLFESEENRKSVELPVSAETFDVLLDYLYTGEPIRFEPRHMVELFAAAQRFELRALAASLRDSFRNNVQRYIERPEFLKAQVNEDVRCLEEPLRGLTLDPRAKLELIGSLNQWCIQNTLNHETFARLTKELYSTVETVEHKVSSSTLFIYAHEDGAESKKVFRDIHSQRKIECQVDFSNLGKTDMVIQNGRLFAHNNNEILVYNVATGEEIEKLPLEKAVGCTVFGGQVYAFNEGQVHLITTRDGAMELTWMATSPKSPIRRLFIVSRTTQQFDFVVQDAFGVIAGVSKLEQAGEETQWTTNASYSLIGTFDENVCVLEPWSRYKTKEVMHIIRDQQFVKSVSIEGCTLYSSCILDNSLYYSYKQKERDAYSVKVISLATGTCTQRIPYENQGLVRFIPVII